MASAQWRIAGMAGLLLLAVASGCGRGETTAPKPGGEASAHKKLVVPPIDTGPVPETRAEDVVHAVLLGLQNDDPHVLWEALPESYRAEINGLVREFGRSVDPEVWDRGFATVQKAVRVGRAKRQFVLAHPVVEAAAGEDSDRVAADYEATLDLLGTLVHTDLSHAERLQTADAGGVLRQTAGGLMQQLSALSRLTPEDPFRSGFKRILTTLRVTTVEQVGDTAVLKLASPETGLEQDVAFVRVQGKWLPRTLAEGWSAGLDDAKESLRRVAAASREHRAAILDRLGRIDGVLEALAAAETQEDFNRVADEQFIAPLRASLQGGSTTAPADAPTADPGRRSVVVQFDRELDPATEEELQPRFSAITDDGQGLAIPRFASGVTQYEVMPVRDVEGFARRIDFAEVLRVDAAGRTIAVRGAAAP